MVQSLEILPLQEDSDMGTLYLFTFYILGVEVLSKLIAKSKVEGFINGVNIPRNNIPISHLFYANDIPLFGKLYRREASHFKDLVLKYGEFSRQKPNFAKFVILFSKNAIQSNRNEMRDILRIQQSTSNMIYLGNPLFIPKNKT